MPGSLPHRFFYLNTDIADLLQTHERLKRLQNLLNAVKPAPPRHKSSHTITTPQEHPPERDVAVTNQRDCSVEWYRRGCNPSSHLYITPPSSIHQCIPCPAPGSVPLPCTAPATSQGLGDPCSQNCSLLVDNPIRWC